MYHKPQVYIIYVLLWFLEICHPLELQLSEIALRYLFFNLNLSPLVARNAF